MRARRWAAAAVCVLVAFLSIGCEPSGLSRNDTIVTFAGTGVSGYGGDGGSALEALVSAPWGMTLDTSGNFYFSDRDNACVRKVDTQGVITVYAGTPLESGYSGDGGLATEARLNGPLGLGQDPDGNLVVVDSWNHRVRRVDAATGIITTIAGSGVPGYAGDGGEATAAALSFPQDVAFDSAGNLYIVDTGNNRVRKVADGVISTIAGTGVAGYTGDGTPAVEAALDQPFGIAVDAGDNLYITDGGNYCVRRVDTAGTISTVAGTGVEGYGVPAGPVVTTEVARTCGVAVDAEGALYFTEDNHVRKVDDKGYLLTIAGSGFGYGGDGGPAWGASFMNPWYLHFGPDGSLYIADHSGNRIRRIVPGD